MKKDVAIVLLLVLAVLLSGCLETIPDYKLAKFETEPNKITPGESVHIKVTIENAGDDATPENKFKVGVKIITKGGAQYWNISEPKLIKRLNPNGLGDFEFRAESKPNTPIGDSTFKVYLYSLDTGDEIDFAKTSWFVNDKIDVYVS
jgi:hypothetical protein